ncbi:MAG TPA: esterase-like activity of phytase family protein [Thermomicrobiales bacterium]|nr:esterase-like activity of phytase family protein [Thermomicrobiales bacterium]
MKRSAVSLSALVLSAACALSPLVSMAQTPAATPAPVDLSSVRIIGTTTIPNDLMVDGTLVGGLSGIDYDAATGKYVIISDDRSDNQPARFYNADVPVTKDGIGPVKIDSAVTFEQSNGTPFPNQTVGGNVPDPEAIRIDPNSGDIFWTSEGSQARLINPFIAVAAPDGKFIASPQTPPIFDMSSTGLTGPRDNLAFEGLSFSTDGNSLWLATEGPLYQDGPVASATSGAPTRITNLDRSGNILGQYAYELDPLPIAPVAGGFSVAGVSEILAIDAHRFITIERTSVQAEGGVVNNYLKLYEIDINGATDVKSQQWLTQGGYTPVTKKLILNFNETDVTVDNFEGITWGPTLDDGNRTLIVESDNNFADNQIQEFVALEVQS